MEQEIIQRIELAAKARGISATTLCRLAVNDGKLIARLRSGGTVTLPTLKKIDDWIAAPAPQKEAANG